MTEIIPPSIVQEMHDTRTMGIDEWSWMHVDYRMVGRPVFHNLCSIAL